MYIMPNIWHIYMYTHHLYKVHIAFYCVEMFFMNTYHIHMILVERNINQVQKPLEGFDPGAFTIPDAEDANTFTTKFLGILRLSFSGCLP